MSEPETLPAPVIDWQQRTTTWRMPDLSKLRHDKLERENDAFWHVLPQLLETHRGKYVAIHEGQSVDSGDDQLAVASRVYAPRISAHSRDAGHGQATRGADPALSNSAKPIGAFTGSHRVAQRGKGPRENP